MRVIFADTFYWIALINPQDQWYPKVIKVSQFLGTMKLVTTDEVLTELLTFYANSGIQQRQRTVNFVKNIINDPDIQVIEQTHQFFLSGFSLYEQRMDKGYSLTDCISMQTMCNLEIQEVLTHDKHFTQEGFTILLQ